MRGWFTKTLVLVVCLSVGAFVVQLLEGISSTEFLYLFMGYGDISFKTEKGRLFASVWIFVSIYLFAKAVRHLVEYAFTKMA